MAYIALCVVVAISCGIALTVVSFVATRKRMSLAVIYARYSSSGQTEQSIEDQVRVCRQYAKDNAITIVDTYVDRAMRYRLPQ